MASRHAVIAFSVLILAATVSVVGLFLYPNEGRVVEQSVTVTATVLDHGQGNGSVKAINSLPVAGEATGRLGHPTTTLLFLGDMMFDRKVASRIRSSGQDDYAFAKICNPDSCFFSGWDMVIGNLEGPVTSKRRAPVKEIDFMFDPKTISVLRSVGITGVSQANNHTLDQGRQGADESRQLLLQSGISVFGDQVKDDQASSLSVIERNGTRVALLGFNVSDNPLDKTAAAAALVAARDLAERIVVFVHWGAEYQAKPNANQTSLAHWFVDNGADAVIGGHPHWMQSLEVYKGRPVAYSLGNFIFDQDWSIETGFGLMVGLKFLADGTSLELYPIKIVLSQPVLLSGKERQARLDRLASISDKSLADSIKKGSVTIK